MKLAAGREALLKPTSSQLTFLSKPGGAGGGYTPLELTPTLGIYLGSYLVACAFAKKSESC